MTQRERLMCRTTIVRVYAPDQIPFASIFSRNGLQTFVTAFQFTPLDATEPGEASFGAGLVEVDGNPVTIESLKLSVRRLTLVVIGDSHDAHGALDAVLEQIAASDTRRPSPFRKDAPLTHREDSVIVEHLGFEWRSLLSDRFLRFLTERAIPSMSDDLGTAEIGGIHLTFDVNFSPKSDALIKARIDLSPKQLAIETRAGSHPDDKLYYTVVPVDSERHQSLLEELESSLTRNKLKD